MADPRYEKKDPLLWREHHPYLAKLPAKVAEYLDEREWVLEPRRTKIVLTWMTFEERGVGLKRVKRPENYHFEKFGDHDAIYRWLRRSWGKAHDASDAWLYPSGALPVYRVNFGWARKHLKVLDEATRAKGARALSSGIALVREDHGAGIVNERFAGIFPSHPNPSRQYWEAAIWGFSRASRTRNQ